MFTRVKQPTLLDREINRALVNLAKKQDGSDEFDKALERVTKLYKLKENEMPSPISKDTLIMAGTNLLGILLIIRHEHVNVITSRAMQMVRKT